MAGSSYKRCSPEVITSFVVAGRRNALDVSSTLSVRREDLRRFARSVTRMGLSVSHALRV